MNKQKTKAWVRLIVTVAIALEIILIFVMNRDNKADLWLFFGVKLTQVPIIVMLIVTVIASIGGFLLIKGLRGTFREIGKPAETGKKP